MPNITIRKYIYFNCVIVCFITVCFNCCPLVYIYENEKTVNKVLKKKIT